MKNRKIRFAALTALFLLFLASWNTSSAYRDEQRSVVYWPTSNIVAGYTLITFTPVDFYFDYINHIWEARDEYGNIFRGLIPDSDHFTWMPPYPGTWRMYLIHRIEEEEYNREYKLWESPPIIVRGNQHPVIQNLTYEPNPAIVGREVRMTVFAADPDGDPLTYAWTVKKPNGQQITLQNNSIVTFKPDMLGNWIVTVTVSDPYGGVATHNQTIAVADFGLSAAIEPPEASRGQKIMIYASLTEPDGRRIQADSISATLPNGQSIGMRWDSNLNRYVAEYPIPDGGSPGVWPGDGSYVIKVRATKYGITKEQTLRVVIRGNIKEKLYIRQYQF